MKTNLIKLAWAGAVLVASSAAALASPVQTVFTGTVASDLAPDAAGIDVGTAVTATFTYDPALLVATPINLGGTGPSISYLGVDMVLQIGAQTVTGTGGSIAIGNNAFFQPSGGTPTEADLFRFGFASGSGVVTDPSGANFQAVAFRATLPTSTFSDASLPGDFPLTGALSLTAIVSEGTDDQRIIFDITSSTTGPVPDVPDPAVIPLPASAAALLAGIAALAGGAALRRRQTG
jgi:hypothetical protein